MIRTVLAAVLALYLAYALELETPYSAATTVLIVASPLRGALLSKSVYRILGTLIGALASLVLIAWFAQTPVLFMIAFAVWLGLCTAVSTMLRHFRAYGAVLAGYTVTLMAISAVDAPERFFDIAASRLAVVTLGVVCAGLMSSLFSTGGAARDLRVAYRAVARDVAAVLHRALSDPQVSVAQQAGLTARVHALDDLISFAGSESAAIDVRSELVIHGRVALSALLSFVPGLARMRGKAEAAGAADELKAAVTDLDGILSDPDLASAGPKIEALRTRLATVSIDAPFRESQRASVAALHRMMLRDRLEEVLDMLVLVVAGFRASEGRGPIFKGALRVAHHREGAQAVINGWRAALAVLLGGAFWIVTGWSSGGMMLSMQGPVVSLLATRDRPDLASVDFMLGGAVAAVVASLFVFGVLPHISGFPLLAVVFAIFLAPGVYVSAGGRWAMAATAYLIFFVTFSTPNNPMTYDPVVFGNNVLALLTGGLFAFVSFRILLPVNRARAIRRLLRLVMRDVARLARGGAMPSRPAWSSRIHGRLVRLSAWLPPRDPSREVVLTGGFGLIGVGRALFRLKAALAAARRPAGTDVRDALRAIAALPRDQAGAIRRTRKAAHRLLGEELAAESRDGQTIRVALSLLEISRLLQQHRAFVDSAQ